MHNKSFLFIILGSIIIAILILGGLFSTNNNVIEINVLAEAFTSNNLEVHNIVELKDIDYGLAPVANEGYMFLLPSIGKNYNARILSFNTISDRDASASFYKTIGEKNRIFYSHVFVHKNIVLQMHGDIPEDVAKQYEAVLKEQ